MSDPVIVHVRWRDSLTGIGGWHPASEAKQHAVDAWETPLSAAGFVVEETDDYVVLASGWNPVAEGEPEVNGTMMIPRSEIVDMRTWKQGRK